MNLKYLFWCVILFILVHFVCYFFNVDLFELFEKQSKIAAASPHVPAHVPVPATIDDAGKEDIDKNINSLTECLEQLKEIAEN